MAKQNTKSNNPSQNEINNEVLKITSFTLKGSSFPLTVIQLLTTDLKQLSNELSEKTKQAPNFFKNVPVVLDAMQISISEELSNSFDLLKTRECLKNNGFIIVGISNANNAIKEFAIKNHIALMPDTNKNNSNKANKDTNIKEPNSDSLLVNSKLNDISNLKDSVEEVALKNKIITTPVRSGQQIYAQGGDLIVISSVGNGAELLADGNIHIYGPMRGRALAGILGDETTHIFCNSLEAELISIAGQYQVSEVLRKTPYWKQNTHISLKNNKLTIKTL